MGFSENLKAIRNSKGMTQEQLAKKIGVFRQTIIEWENPDGKRPEFDSLVWLHDALGVSWNKLMTGEESKPKARDPMWEKVAPVADVLMGFAKQVDAIVGIETNEFQEDNE